MRDWVKAWRPRPGSAFEARVSPLAKDWFRGILVHFDDEGVMCLPKSKTPHGALGIRLGYPKGQRRTIAGLMAECIEHECIIAEQDAAGFWTLTAPSWAPFQAKQKGENKAPPRQPPASKPVRTEGHETPDRAPTTYPESKMGTDRGTRIIAKSPESLNTASTDKSRVEEERENARADARFRDPLGVRDQVPPGAFATRLYVQAMRDLADPHYDEMRLTGRDRERLSDLTAWATTVADSYAEHGEDWQAVYAQALAGSIDVWRDEAKRRPGSVPLNPGGWWAKRESWRQAS